MIGLHGSPSIRATGFEPGAERFCSTLEFELRMQCDWHAREEARRAVFRYIETWYNRKRRHSTMRAVSLTEYEAQLKMAA